METILKSSRVCFLKQNKEKTDKQKTKLLNIESKLAVARGEVGGMMCEIGEGD